MKKQQFNKLKWLAKPLVFFLALVPFLALVIGIIDQDLGADPQKYIVHKTGEWSLRFLLITLAITPVRRWFNILQLIKFRRMMGLFVMFYSSLHLISYYLLLLEGDIRNVIEDIVERPYITVGFTAWLLLLPLAFTSTKKMMKRLGRNWGKLHRLIYWITGLALLHFIWLIKSDLNEPVLYLLIAIILGGYRIWYANFRKRFRV